MNAFYLRGAFLLLPTLMGWTLACLLCGHGWPTFARAPDRTTCRPREWFTSLVRFSPHGSSCQASRCHRICHLTARCALNGYGSFPAPTVEQYRSPHIMPNEVASVQGDEDDIEFSVYITLPNLPEDLPISSMPLAILLHGFGYPDVDAYQDWINHLLPKAWPWRSSSTRRPRPEGQEHTKPPTNKACRTISNTF